MEAKITLKLYTQQLKIFSYMFWFILEKNPPHSTKNSWKCLLSCLHQWSHYTYGFADFSILPWMPIEAHRRVQSCDLPFYCHTDRMSCPLFLLKWADFMRTGLPWKQQSLLVLAWVILAIEHKHWQAKKLHKNEDQPQKWHLLAGMTCT